MPKFEKRPGELLTDKQKELLRETHDEEMMLHRMDKNNIPSFLYPHHNPKIHQISNSTEVVEGPTPKKHSGESPEELTDDIKALIQNPNLPVPNIYNDTPEGLKREQILTRYLRRENQHFITNILKESGDKIDKGNRSKIEQVVNRYARLATYIRVSKTIDEYLEYLDPLADELSKQIVALASPHVSEDIIRNNTTDIIRLGGAADEFAGKYNLSLLPRDEFDASSPIDRDIARKHGINIELNSIEEMEQESLDWYYQKINNDSEAKAPKNMTIEQLLKDKKYKKILDIRRAIGHTILPVGGAITAGALTGGAGVLAHVGYSVAGGGAGLVGSALWNKRGESGSRLYDAQLLQTLYEFNKQLDRKEGIYLHKPNIKIVRETLKRLWSEPPTRGTAFHKISRTALRNILDQRLPELKDRQKKTSLAVATASTLSTLWMHMGNS